MGYDIIIVALTCQTVSNDATKPRPLRIILRSRDYATQTKTSVPYMFHALSVSKWERVRKEL